MASYLDRIFNLERQREGYGANLRQGDILGLFGNVLQTVRDESGVDDYVRALKYARSGEFGKLARSLGTGLAETLSLAATGGASIPAKFGGKQLLTRGATKGVGRLGKFLVPLSKGEQGAARAARLGLQYGKGGQVVRRPLARRFMREALTEADAARNVFIPAGGSARKPFMSLMGRNPATNQFEALNYARAGLRRPRFIARRLPESLGMRRPMTAFGYGRGGIVGSLARGTGQALGYLPLNAPERVGGVIGRALPLTAMIGARTGFSPTGATFTSLIDQLLSGELRPQDIPEGVLAQLVDILENSQMSGNQEL